ncbi:MAG: nucleotide-binding protein [Candidatus Woesearchaeota archaeon]
MKTVILDTNFLVDCLSWKVDFFSEIQRILPFNYRLAVVDKTLDELDLLEKKGKMISKLGARLAKQVISKKSIGIIRTDKKGYTDTLILKSAGRDSIVATQDQNLKRRLKAKGIPVIVIRQKKYLELFPKP